MFSQEWKLWKVFFSNVMSKIHFDHNSYSTRLCYLYPPSVIRHFSLSSYKQDFPTEQRWLAGMVGWALLETLQGRSLADFAGGTPHLRLVVRKPHFTGSESDIPFFVNYLLAVKFSIVVIRPYISQSSPTLSYRLRVGIHAGLIINMDFQTLERNFFLIELIFNVPSSRSS
jgi:hypothetical protein